MAHTVHVGAVQGAVAHVVYRVRKVPPAEHHRRLADDDQYADGRYVLRPVRRSRHDPYPIVRYLQTSLQRKGNVKSFFCFDIKGAIETESGILYSSLG